MNGLCLPVVSGPKPAVHMPKVNLSLFATEAIAEEFSRCYPTRTILATNLVTSPASQVSTRIWQNVLGGERDN
jgi:hypothetical protein